MVEAILGDCLLVGRRGSWVPRLWARGLQLKEKTDIIVKQETRKTTGLCLGVSFLPLGYCDVRFIFLHREGQNSYKAFYYCQISGHWAEYVPPAHLCHGYQGVTRWRLIGDNLDRSLTQWNGGHIVGAIGAEVGIVRLAFHL